MRRIIAFWGIMLCVLSLPYSNVKAQEKDSVLVTLDSLVYDRIEVEGCDIWLDGIKCNLIFHCDSTNCSRIEVFNMFGEENVTPLYPEVYSCRQEWKKNGCIVVPFFNWDYLAYNESFWFNLVFLFKTDEGYKSISRPTNKIRVADYMTNKQDIEIIKQNDANWGNYFTNINTPVDKESKSSSSIYDLTGRRLSTKPQKGIYIQGGKKHVVR